MTVINTCKQTGCYGDFYEKGAGSENDQCPLFDSNLTQEAVIPVDVSASNNSLTAEEKEAFFEQISFELDRLYLQKTELEQKIHEIEAKVVYYQNQ